MPGLDFLQWLHTNAEFYIFLITYRVIEDFSSFSTQMYFFLRCAHTWYALLAISLKSNPTFTWQKGDRGFSFRKACSVLLKHGFIFICVSFTTTFLAQVEEFLLFGTLTPDNTQFMTFRGPSAVSQMHADVCQLLSARCIHLQQMKESKLSRLLVSH